MTGFPSRPSAPSQPATCCILADLECRTALLEQKVLRHERFRELEIRGLHRFLQDLSQRVRHLELQLHTVFDARIRDAVDQVLAYTNDSHADLQLILNESIEATANLLELQQKRMKNLETDLQCVSRKVGHRAFRKG